MNTEVRFGNVSAMVPMKRVFRNSSDRVISVRVGILGDAKTMSPGDTLSIPDIPGEYIVELLT